MTSLEVKAIDATKELWNAFLQLPEMHPDDQNDFRYHIHALQNIILAREGQRVINGVKDSVHVSVDTNGLKEAIEKLKTIPAPSFIEGGIVKGGKIGII